MSIFDYKLLGSIIREKRNEDGRTQLDFSIDANISKSFYGRLELGEHNISLDTFNKICQTLNIPMSLLIKEYENSKN